MTLLAIFQELKRIFGVCPCCGDIFRLSDATLFTREKPPQTPFDRLARREALLDRQEERFEEQEGELRARAIERGQRDAQGRLRKVCPRFLGTSGDPHDVRVLFDPVQYVSFRGLSARQPSAIEFIDSLPDSRAQERLHRSFETTIQGGNIEWNTYRIDEDGRVTST